MSDNGTKSDYSLKKIALSAMEEAIDCMKDLKTKENPVQWYI